MTWRSRGRSDGGDSMVQGAGEPAGGTWARVEMRGAGGYRGITRRQQPNAGTGVLLSACMWCARNVCGWGGRGELSTLLQARACRCAWAGNQVSCAWWRRHASPGWCSSQCWSSDRGSGTGQLELQCTSEPMPRFSCGHVRNMGLCTLLGGRQACV